MSDEIVYLDHAATSPVCRDIAEHLARDVQELGWNAGTRYELGLTARRALEQCRAQIAGYLGCDTDAVIFTSGGTESNNLGLHACSAQLPKGGVLWNSATTHPSLSGPVEAMDRTWNVIPMPITAGGAIDPAALADLPPPDVVVLEWVNNEVGFLQPIADVAARARALNPSVCILVDGSQGFGKLALPNLRDITAFTLAGHKIGAPVGVGGLMLAPSLTIAPLTHGGGQEHGWRPGTVAVPLVRSFCRALERITAVDAPPFAFAPVDSGSTPRPVQSEEGTYSPFITMLDVVPVEGEVLQHHLEADGIFIGTGSACSSTRKGISPIHKAMGMDAAASRGTVRWSTIPGQGPDTLNRAWRMLVKQWRELKRFF